MALLLQKIVTDKLFRNTSWMMLTEAVSKISRLLTVVVMAAYLSPEAFGIAALALACHELIRIFSRAGAGAVVIGCSEERLKRTAANASLLQWITCVVLTGLQWSIAERIALFYQEPQLEVLLKTLAWTYLCYPLVAVKVFMLQRQNRFRYFSLANAATVITDNLAIAALLFMGEGIMAVAYAKILAALVWILVFGFAKVETLRPSFHRATFVRLTIVSVQLFLADSLRALRFQVDVFIAARLLDPLYFGYYSFAKSAGVGLSQSLTQAFLSSLYPYICEQLRAGREQPALRKATLFAGTIALVFVLQSLAAPIYIPILFNSKWDAAIPIVSILCLTGITAILADTFSSFIRAKQQAKPEMILMAASVACFVFTILIFQPNNGIALASVTTVASVFWLLPVLYVKKIPMMFIQPKVVT